MAKSKVKKNKESSLDFVAIWKEVCHKQKGLMTAMIVLAVMSVILLIFSFTTLRPQSTVVIVGYGDVYGEIAGISGGYRRDSWLNMLAFPLLAVLFGFVHNLLVLRLYNKRGRDAALVLVVVTMCLIAASVLTIIRLLGEW